ncbi:MAG TPA: fatty acyl-AMP ligase [Kofleriaceae bacterium]|nr:fatty acyl-AMP ligase [Kofleriaceae bacterium]
MIAALDALQGWTDRGFTFLDHPQREQFFSFDRLRTEAMQRAAHFRHHGLRPGDRVAMVIPDGADFVTTFLGAVWAGLVPVPLYPPLSLGKLDSYIETVVMILAKARPTHVVTNVKLQQVLWSGLAKVPGFQGVITVEQLRDPAPAGVSQAPAEVTGDELCFLQFTSGSTSTPKGVMVTHDNLRANAAAIMRDGLQTDPAIDHGVSWLPLYHDMGLIGFVISPIFHRVQVTFIATLVFARNPTIWLETIHRVRGTITFAPNFAYALIVKRATPEQRAAWDLSSMRHFGCGAEPINPTTMRTFVETFAPAGLAATSLLPCYGMAEATLAISFIGIDEALSTDIIDAGAYQTQRRAEPAAADQLAGGRAQEFVRCGRSFPGHDVGAFDAAGARLGDRRVGELWVRGPSVARGYYEDPVATEHSFGGGWLRTGDYGYLVDGHIYITGRKKDLIIINGRNYDPQRLEWLVDELPEVRKGSTVAVSRPGPGSEELIIVLESKTTNAGALQERVRARVADQMQLVAADVVVCPVGSLPKTSSGKLQRARTREQYLAGTLGKAGNRTLGANAEKLVLARHVVRSLVGRAQHRAKQLVSHTRDRLKRLLG